MTFCANSGVVDLVGLYSCFSFPEWRFVRFVFLPGTWLVSSSLVLTIAASFWRWDLCFPCISYLVLVPLLGAPVLAELFAPRACSLWRLRPWWPSRLSSYAGVWVASFCWPLLACRDPTLLFCSLLFVVCGRVVLLPRMFFPAQSSSCSWTENDNFWTFVDYYR